MDQKSVGQRATRARERERRADFCERRKLLQLLSQLLPRHALQVSIDKERASPPQKKTYHRYTGGSGPGERLASAL